MTINFESKLPLFAALTFALASVACGTADDSSTPTPSPAADTPTPAPSPDPAWEVSQVGEEEIGLQTRLAVGPDGNPAIATWATSPFEDGLCDELETDPPTRLRQRLLYLTRASDGLEWSIELVDEPVVAFSPTGLSMRFDPAGRATLAYTGGEPEGQYCGGNDAVLAVRDDGSWSMETAAAESDDAFTGEPASDAGFVVGQWPGLAYGPDDEPAIVYKDVHFGSLQRDDLYRADTELTRRSGTIWSQQAIDAGEGAGDFGTLVFDADGRPVAFYAIIVDAQDGSRRGVWAARLESDGQWTRVQLHTGAIHLEVPSGVDPLTGDLVVAFYSENDRAVRLRRLHDPDGFGDPEAWESELVASAAYDEGRYVSIAFRADGRVAMAYHRCRRLTSSSDSCDQNDEAAIFASETADGWEIDVLREASRGSCGEYTAVAIDSEGTTYVAFRCTIETDDGRFEYRLFVAQRETENGTMVRQGPSMLHPLG